MWRIKGLISILGELSEREKKHEKDLCCERGPEK
jgi:hypothetical protein